ncbi:MAG: Peptide methionine sulfoxide reductase MsrA [Chloroflexi bacterium]|nr:Peptide methionine sulfoxide reductase MsrA [Chloroflexota bacterium]
MFWSTRAPEMPAAASALPGRAEPILEPGPHHVSGRPIAGPYPDGSKIAEFALGCFWGAEKGFWQAPGVWVTAVGYQGGFTPNATYREACSGKTGHAEAVRVVYDPLKISYDQLLAHFWEAHDPTQGMRQGNDIGTQYRSAILPRTPAQRDAAVASRDTYQARLTAAGFGQITTEITGPPAPEFYFAEDYHQQYLVKNPNGYCPDHGTGVSCPIGLVVPVTAS